MNIYYLCPDIKHACGGIKIIYRHVDLLNANGFSAYVLHHKNGFRCDWFVNETRIAYLKPELYRRIYNKAGKILHPEAVRKIPLSQGKQSFIDENDILVMPEFYGPDIVHFGQGIKKIILNQNGFMTFQGYSFVKDRLITPYTDKDTLGALVNSEHCADYLKYAFPETQLYRFYLSIDPALFSYQEKKKKQICFSQVKNSADAMQIINILKFRNALADFELVPFVNISEHQVAELMKESLIFISLGNREGFGLPPAEAMACGCITIGYHGWGGEEFFKSEHSFPINDGDIIHFADTIEKVIQAYNNDNSFFLKERKQAADFISKVYSLENEKQALISAWKTIIH
ncbi:glycosyltransferase [methanotrophic endosymbiont of Bathymodiolus puteoserpentis (Logatchev)]|uniref:glycosyltransferase n=1 Tax=methanotrophic endosymbiont of Bathymodiolus puteoserpentis (Logatchev) TaxID=343235 RepID=UPI00157B64FC|nr:glycosyltransferase [methanotrophic endosymbiont of Bathymodiolus puteoserpentis (Logatchev)]